MKFSWGIGIALSYVLFVVIIVSLVIFSSTKDVNLVTDEYYADELKYQDQIEKVKRTGSLSDELAISTDINYIQIQFPPIFANSQINGEILFYRPSDRKKDFLVNIELNEDNKLVVRKSGIDKGLWKIKINWSAGDQEYYNEKILMID